VGTLRKCCYRPLATRGPSGSGENESILLGYLRFIKEDFGVRSAWLGTTPVKSLYTGQSVKRAPVKPQNAVFFFRSTMNSPGG